jgi:single-stranded DNA-binding protein
MYQHHNRRNLGKDAEMRYTPAGRRLPVSVQRRIAPTKLPMDNRLKRPPGSAFSIFGKTAENLTQYLTKGKMVLVEGHLTPDKKTGGPRMWQSRMHMGASFDVFASNIKLMPGGQRGEGSPPVSDEDMAGAPETTGDEEIPF